MLRSESNIRVNTFHFSPKYLSRLTCTAVQTDLRHSVANGKNVCGILQVSPEFGVFIERNRRNRKINFKLSTKQ